MNQAEASEKQLVRRCPRLGGPVSFHYCRTCEQGKKACWKIVDCWWEIFDVVRYLQDTMPVEEFNSITEKKPKPKIASILDLVEKTHKRPAKPES